MASDLEAAASFVQQPRGGDKVYKDECAFCFDSPESPSGLYICLSSWLGLGEAHVERHYERTGSALYLHMIRKKRELPEEEKSSKPVTKMAIGVDGGFDSGTKKYTFDEMNTLVWLTGHSPVQTTVMELTDARIPVKVQEVVTAVLAAESAAKQEELAAMAGTWDGEMRMVSKHAGSLQQHDSAGKTIPPSGWKCEQCDLTTNLWLNLTDGSILCGRRFYDGSGGNNHALEHYAVCRYPLAVKLGTITPDGGGDVFSYDEDDMVQDPHLAKHLEHWGIKVASMEKTDKTMAELEIDINQRIMEWDVIQEAGQKLEPCYGAGYTGMRNLGNSCYMNSVLQVLFSLPDFTQRYFDQYPDTIRKQSDNPPKDFNIQISKVAHGLLSGDYSQPITQDPTVLVESRGVRPQMFKSLVGAGHPEFSSKRQQDAHEFLLHLLDMIERNSRGGAQNPVDCFRFSAEERTRCEVSGQVRYVTRDEIGLELPVAEEDMTNAEEVTAYRKLKAEADAQNKPLEPSQLVRPRIPLSRCLERLAADESVADFYSSAIKNKTTATKRYRMLTFPDFLVLKLRKFTVSADWTPSKLDVAVDMPDQLDLAWIKAAGGLQPGEVALPEAAEPKEPAFEFDEGIVSQLASMGFAVEGCKRAVFHTKNAGAEQAMEWVMLHMGDADFADPFDPPSSSRPAPVGAESGPSEDNVAMVMALGFTRPQAIKALKATNDNVERAADWIFSHPDDLNTPDEPAMPAKTTRDGAPKYELMAFISHMGSSCMVGHYVCHIRKQGRWVIYNDENVALSKKPPIDLGYVYVYKRL